MAQDLAFYCPACKYYEEFNFVGSTRTSIESGKPENILVLCKSCSLLALNTKRQCKCCLRIEAAHFKIFGKVKVSFPSEDQMINPIRIHDYWDGPLPCPKCRYEFLKYQRLAFMD